MEKEFVESHLSSLIIYLTFIIEIALLIPT